MKDYSFTIVARSYDDMLHVTRQSCPVNHSHITILIIGTMHEKEEACMSMLENCSHAIHL